MVTYQSKELGGNGVRYLVGVEIFEENNRFYARLTPRQDMVLNVGHPHGPDSFLQVGKQSWCLELEAFVESYEPIPGRKPLKLGGQ